ncbi:MAG: hypothetical protein CVU59_05035 [Deltaproteobacteria bacterium HGW-Deltaproteobacteria-17]|jgi:hypothetical protein|nr:MAG: hypothetical protein CVU59_05035 [Deltaproteobacteria bacterium HGW-Deltaproteobacteria-17]
MRLSVSSTKSGAILDGRGPEITQTGLDRLVTLVTMFLLAETKKRTPQGVYGAQGGLLGSIQEEVKGKGTPVIKGVVMSAQKYAEPIEKGRASGKSWPPEGSLVRWIEVKFGVDNVTAKRLEFVVRRKIGRKGFPGAHMFERAATENTGRIDAMAAAEGFKIAVELES